MLLALGATRLEATREVVQRAARVALTPLLNTMNVVVSWAACGPAQDCFSSCSLCLFSHSSGAQRA